MTAPTVPQSPAPEPTPQEQADHIGRGFAALMREQRLAAEADKRAAVAPARAGGREEAA